MKNIILTILAVLLIAALTGGNIFLFSEKQKSEIQIVQEKAVSQKWQERLREMEAAKKQVEKDTARLRADALNYVDLNNKLQSENQRLRKHEREAKKLKKIINEKDRKIKAFETPAKSRDEDEERSKERVASEREKAKLTKEIKALKNEFGLLEDTLTKERALYHYNLGVVYAKARLYEEALAAYQKSLEFRSDNPEAYYNLGLLYGEVKQDPLTAAFYYRKYLEFKPGADDREEIQQLIDRYMVDELTPDLSGSR